MMMQNNNMMMQMSPAVISNMNRMMNQNSGSDNLMNSPGGVMMGNNMGNMGNNSNPMDYPNAGSNNVDNNRFR